VGREQGRRSPIAIQEAGKISCSKAHPDFYCPFSIVPSPLVKKYLSLVKFTHTIFALPFALTGFFLGVMHNGGQFEWRLLLLVVLCMVFARNAAMGFNRWADRDIDAANARTQVREIPSGAIPATQALWFVILNAVAFIATTFFINWLCFFLSPVALAVVLGYSLTKRITALCHLVLGLGLSLAPVGAFIAVTGQFHAAPVVLGVAVLTWVSGFDIIYALQDEQFDREHKLHSIPAFLGRNRALYLSSFLHLLTATCIATFIYLIGGEYLAWGAAFFFVCMLVYQHTIVKPNDLSRVNMAFFTTNGIASVVFATLVICELLFFAAKTVH
jgi:4-hydroxybenzoate polyprenyltransferase